MFVTNGIYLKISLPTRFSRKSCSLIDQIFCTYSSKTKNSVSGILYSSLSDHFACFTAIDIFDGVKTKPADKYIKVFNHSKTDIDNFCREIEKSLNKSSYDPNLPQDPNQNYQILNYVISSAKEKHLPSKLIKVNKYKHKWTPWIATGIMNFF